MNDRAVSLFEQYDIEVIRTRKGRGSILCESRQGLFTLKEFIGSKEKAEIMDILLTRMRKQLPSDIQVEAILKNKEGGLLTEDTDGTVYMVKSWFEGRECNVKDIEECETAVSILASLHNTMTLSKELVNDSDLAGVNTFSLGNEYLRHNKELKKVRRFLKEKSQKTDFELFLNKNYDYYLNQAEQILQDYSQYSFLEDEGDSRGELTFCHGDYQYHNILITDNRTSVINFDKIIIDRQIRDLYLFMRKILEKSNWSQETGERLIAAYDKVRPISAEDRISLYYRFAYPEKFWKIVNFYYNSRKSWIPGKNMEKLQKVLTQEKDKQQFLDEVLGKV